MKITVRKQNSYTLKQPFMLGLKLVIIGQSYILCGKQARHAMEAEQAAISSKGLASTEAIKADTDKGRGGTTDETLVDRRAALSESEQRVAEALTDEPRAEIGAVSESAEAAIAPLPSSWVSSEERKYYKKAMNIFCCPHTECHGFMHRYILEAALLMLAKSLQPGEPIRVSSAVNFYLGKKLSAAIKDNLKPLHTIETPGGKTYFWEYLEADQTLGSWLLSPFKAPHRLHIVFVAECDKQEVVVREHLTVEYGIIWPKLNLQT